MRQNPYGFGLMLGQSACGNWRSYCDHRTGVYALWGVINTAAERKA